jgi:TetR/AcrR family transcriptional regulator, cholesterol catabolism regulator
MPPRARSNGSPGDPSAARKNGASPDAPVAPVARLAANQLRRMRRIVDAAVDLAEKGGFEAVRLRDVAEKSDVALGTLYKYFRSKEDILLFALNEEVERLENTLVSRPETNGTERQRAVEFFRRSTRALSRRPQLARAMVRAMAAGDADTVMKLASLQLRIARLVTATLRGVAPDLAAPLDQTGSATEQAVAQVLMNVWFSSLVGWAAGLHAERVVTEHVRTAVDLVVAA